MSQTAFSSIVPSNVKIFSIAHFVDNGPLSTAEREYIATASLERRRDFSTGRKCAVAALEQLGVHVLSIGRNEDRQPDWPPGVVGSITHCEDLCAAAVSQTYSTRFLGIDAEPNKALSDGLLERIASPDEMREIQSAPNDSVRHHFADCTLFSIKESVFKALYPIVGVYFGFEEVDVRLDLGPGRCRLLLSPLLRDATGLASVEGRFVNTRSHTLTAVHIGYQHVATNSGKEPN